MTDVALVGAHADDIELSAGGFVSNLTAKGHNVYCILMTASDFTNYDGKIERTLADARVESLEALRVLGVNDERVYNLNIQTKHVKHDAETVERLNAIIDNICPDLIITHHHNCDSHQDHLNTAKCVLSASRKYNNIWMFEPIYPSKLSSIPFRPIIYTDISQHFTKKLQSIKCHRSQVDKHSYWSQLVFSVNKMRGIEAQKDFCECFEPIKMTYEVL